MSVKYLSCPNNSYLLEILIHRNNYVPIHELQKFHEKKEKKIKDLKVINDFEPNMFSRIELGFNLIPTSIYMICIMQFSRSTIMHIII